MPMYAFDLLYLVFLFNEFRMDSCEGLLSVYLGNSAQKMGIKDQNNYPLPRLSTIYGWTATDMR